MKFNKVILGFVISMLAMSAEAQIKNIELTSVQQNDQTLDMHNALLRVDTEKNMMNLTIYNDVCGRRVSSEEAKCLAMETVIERIEVKIISIKDDGCGSKIYTGVRPSRGFDDFTMGIRYTDNSKRVCEDVLEALNVVEAKKTGGFAGLNLQYRLTDAAR